MEQHKAETASPQFLRGLLTSSVLSILSGLLEALILDLVLSCPCRLRSLLCPPLKTDPHLQRTGSSSARLVSELKSLPEHCSWEILTKLSWYERPPISSCGCCAYSYTPRNFHPHFARIEPGLKTFQTLNYFSISFQTHQCRLLILSCGRGTIFVNLFFNVSKTKDFISFDQLFQINSFQNG